MLPSTVSATVFPYDSNSLRVFFSEPVGPSAVLASSFSLVNISNISVTHVPSITDVSWFDGQNTEVIIRFQDSLTFDKTYSLTCIAIPNSDNDAQCDTSFNFVFTVPDNPHAIAAVPFQHKIIDVIFDKDVRDFSGSVTGAIYELNTNNSSPLTLLGGPYPKNRLRFSFSTVPTATNYEIKLFGVQAASLNPVDTRTKIDFKLIVPGPYTAPHFEQIQVIGARVVHVNPLAVRTHLNVYFNGPPDLGSVTNKANWIIRKKDVHILEDNEDQLQFPGISSYLDLYDYAEGACIYLNYHVKSGLTNQRHQFHKRAFAGPTLESVVFVTNDILQKFARHLSSIASHSFQDSSSIDQLSTVPSSCYDLATAIVCLNSLKTAYGIHSINGPHSPPATQYPIVSPNATDLDSAALLAEELRLNIRMHMRSPVAHTVPDKVNNFVCPPIFPYTITAASSNFFKVAGILTEYQEKLFIHLRDASLHKYQDLTNIVPDFDFDLTQTEFDNLDFSRFGPALMALSVIFDQHYDVESEVPILDIIYNPPDQLSDPVGAYQYYCTLVLKTGSPNIEYDIFSSVMDEANVTWVDGGEFLRIEEGPVQPKVLDSEVHPDSLEIRLNGDFELPDPEELIVDGLNIISIVGSCSVEFLSDFVSQLILGHNDHLLTGGHKTLDETNRAIVLPTNSVTDVVSALNSLRLSFASHIASGVYHTGSDSRPVPPPAFDLKSAILLAGGLQKFISEHNSDLGLHSGPGTSFTKPIGFDIFSVGIDTPKDGKEYEVLIPIKETSTRRSLGIVSFPFIGVVDRPVLSSVVPKLGLDSKTLKSDILEAYFSRPMKKSDPTLIYSQGLNLGSPRWVDDRTLAIKINSMSGGSKFFTVRDIFDTAGNEINNYEDPPPATVLSLPFTAILGAGIFSVGSLSVVRTAIDSANIIAEASRFGPFWQDFGKTIPAVTPGDPVRVWEVPGGDLILTGGSPGILAFGGGVTFPSGGTHFTSTLSSGSTFSLYVDCDPQPGYNGTNIVACSSTAELSTWIQPYFSGSITGSGVGFPTGGFASTADEPVERVRGMAAAGSTVTAFSGDNEFSGTYGVGSINTLRIGCSDPTFHFRGTVRSVLLYGVSHNMATRAAVRLWMAQQAAPTTMRSVFALHVEGSESLLGAAKTSVDAYNAAHGADAPITVCASPNTYTLGATAPDITSRYQGLLGPNGELAVHVHGQNAWITILGVTTRYLETFASAITPGSGYDTTWDSYDYGESLILFDGAADLFEAQGFPRPRTMLLGGYFGDDDNRLAMVAAGYTRDLSQVPASLTSSAYASFPNLQSKIATGYAGITPYSQPTSSGGLLRIPSTGAVLNYNSILVAKERVSRQIQAGRGSSFVNVEGVHLDATDVDSMTAHVTWMKAYCIERAITFSGMRANQIVLKSLFTPRSKVDYDGRQT